MGCYNKDSSIRKHIKEIKGELNIYKVALGNEVLAMAPRPKVDVLKQEEFNGMRSAKECGQVLVGNRVILLCKRNHG
ncbi:hypothetical protein J1N35_007366 [Gossypium stocksii]|uniref:Uncharacterized protein n=1 Tax=Gossypium stocksii TaxID=47602 RepID=A0A9D3W8D6_9ROSI|nr:hypothetical protein J1N35_007366 [Gossypium stocksii]